MRTISDIVDRVCEKLGKTDANTKAQAKKFLQTRYRYIYQKHLWRDALLTYQISTANREIVFPAKVERVLACYQENYPLLNTDVLTELMVAPEDAENSGTAARWAGIRVSGVAAMSQDEKLTLVADAADTTTVTILGEDSSGNQIKEVVTLTGTTPVDTTTTWEQDRILSISRDADTTTVTITGKTSTDALQTLRPGVHRISHQVVQLFQKPDTAKTFTFICKRAWMELDDDSDTPLLQGVDMALEAFTHGDMLEWLKQYGKADRKFMEGQSLLKQAADEETWQRGGSIVITPQFDGSVEDGGYDRYNFLRG